MSASLAALLWFRGTAAIILGGVGMIVLVLSARRSTFLPRLGVASLALLVVSPRLADLLGGYLASGTWAPSGRTSTQHRRHDLVRRGRRRTRPAETSSFVDSILRVALGPYPWEWPTLGAPFAFDGVVWWAVIALTAVRLVEGLEPGGAAAGRASCAGHQRRADAHQRQLRHHAAAAVQTSVLLLPVVAAGWGASWRATHAG